MEAATDPAIVGIGASAGGIRALQALFDAMPQSTGAAFVVIVHLDPEYRSELASILASHTGMAVTQVEDTARLENNHVYVIAPNRRLRVADHMISALPFDEPRAQRAPIDLFFRSLAEHHSDGFAVILSGAGADGALGVRAIKEAGGIVLVQDPNEAEYASMPRNAISTGVADVVLPVRQLAARLAEFLDGRRSAVMESAASDETTLRRILAHVRVRTGHDFSQYKRATVLRRIARRMQVTRNGSVVDYYDHLRENADEAQLLFADFLISVTTFFRDAAAFTVLERDVIPTLFAGKEGGDRIRVWVPGCATGEEAYAIGILLLEATGRDDLRPECQIFGSDLDAVALTVAREGRYPAAIEADVTPDRLRRFFQREGDHYRVRRELRDVVLFAGHSLLRDPPFSRLDLISCRNLLIYLDRNLQQQVCNTFHYALNPDGFLFLGASESADQPTGLFRVVDREARIYRSIATAGRTSLPIPTGPSQMPVRRKPSRGAVPASSVGDALLHRQMLEKIAPPSILVDDTYRAVHLSETVGRYLQPAGGPASVDVTDLVRPELRFDLRAALHRAFEQGESSLSIGIPVQFNGDPHRVYLQIRPVVHEEPARFVLVMFIEGEGAGRRQDEGSPASNDEGPASDSIRQLQEDLRQTRSSLLATREESDATTEELRAANEELQSINEEYRSTSEELETSKEELQSINEELQTVNNELKLKLEGVSRAHSDLQNLMAAADFGTLFLDPSLRIKRFTPPVTDLFNVTANDEGRPITDFTHRLQYPELADHARAVLTNLAPIEHEARSHDERWYLVRIRPYRTVDDKIDGVVMTFVDITERRRAEGVHRDTEERLRQEARLVELSRAPIFVWDFDHGIVQWNRGSEELYGYSPEEAIGQTKERLLRTEVPGSSFAAVRRGLLDKGTWAGEVLHTTKDGRILTVESQAELVSSEERRLVLESTRDITDRKTWETRQKLLLGELNHRIKNTLAVIQTMARQTMQTSESPEDFVERFEGRILALSVAHQLLVEADWQGAELSALARNQLAAYAGDDPNRLRIVGEPVVLPTEMATRFALVLHELATNAAKYGALSIDSGRVLVSWTMNRNKAGWLTVVWEESDGPPVPPPTRDGLGSRLIQQGLPGALVERDFRPDGLVCTVDLDLTGKGADEDQMGP